MCLGLVQDERRAVHGLQRVADDRRISDAVAQHLAHQLEENVDLDALVELASQACMPPVPEGHPAVSFEQEHRVRLAVARDAAFSMYYSEYVPNPLALQQTPGLSLYTLPPPPPWALELRGTCGAHGSGASSSKYDWNGINRPSGLGA